MSTTPVVPTAPTAGPPATGNSGLPTPQSLNNMFLQLLIAQLQNQDPTNPLDPTTFVTQLAQFSELSEVTQIAQLLQQVIPGASSTGGSGSAAGANAKLTAPQSLPSLPSVDSALSSGLIPSTNSAGQLANPEALSPAASAAQAAISHLNLASPDLASPAVSLLNQKIQGVF
jgi:flagellar basal-body rod modification protein FlgD